MANANDPIEALRKSLNAYVISQEAIAQAANEVKPTEAPPATPTESQPKQGG